MIAIIGLGYVGLPLGLQFAKNGANVLGLDIDETKISSINAGESYIHHIAAIDVAEQVEAGRFQASSDFTRVSECSEVVICVPTPLSKNREPDISYVLSTAKSIAPFVADGTLVVLESTTYPGTTDENLRTELEIGSGKKAGEDFFLAFSPEREDPGNPMSKVAKIPKVVGGLTTKCKEKAVALYQRAVEQVVPVSSCRAAEATKLLENIFRSVNIALVNELKLVYQKMDIDIWEVIEAAKTKPFGYMPFYPGPGLGGHCIPIDPFYLTWKAREYGQATRFIELAGEVNNSMPGFVIRRCMEALNGVKKSMNGSRVLVLGLAYKANVDDMRESPSFMLMDGLKKAGAEVQYYDPYIPTITPTREHAEWTGTNSVAWNQNEISNFDLVLISTAHDNVDYKSLSNWVDLIVDSRNAMDGVGGTATVHKA